jgi:imidazole glycerol phosphate synthase glutamine amidotransferase subunit
VILTLVDYGAGNLASVERAFERLGARTRRARRGEELNDAEAIVLPGVGHFGALARAISREGMAEGLGAAVERGAALLGICLGLQVLFAGSEEAPGESGLGWLRGEVRSLPANMKLPHMGWNQVRRTGPSRLLDGIREDAWFYFAHSYAAFEAGEAAVAVCDYGTPFAATVERDRMAAVQFHPEKSGEAGAQVLRNFLEMAG